MPYTPNAFRSRLAACSRESLCVEASETRCEGEMVVMKFRCGGFPQKGSHQLGGSSWGPSMSQGPDVAAASRTRNSLSNFRVP